MNLLMNQHLAPIGGYETKEANDMRRAFHDDHVFGDGIWGLQDSKQVA